MFSTVFALIGLAFCLSGAYFWMVMWRRSWIKYFSAVIAVVGAINLLGETSGVFSIGVFVLGLAVTLYAVKYGGLDEYFEEEKARIAVQQNRVINDKKGQIYGKLGRYEFDYFDREGNKTRRVVNVSRLYYEAGVGYFDGYCEDRKARRTFRLDRVAGDVIDLSTGEVVALG